VIDLPPVVTIEAGVEQIPGQIDTTGRLGAMRSVAA
jgi:hypothetical protein